MRIPRLKLYRNAWLILIGIVGFLLAGWLCPNVSRRVVIPPIQEAQNDLSLPLARIGPRETGSNLFSKPFLFQLGSTDKMTGQEREDILQAQYSDILRRIHGETLPVQVEQIDGMTVVSIDGVAFATVLPVDAPEYYSRLTDERKKQLELKIAQRWKHLLEVDLASETHSRSPESLVTFPYVAACLFFLALIFHGLADAFSRHFLRSPGWSLKAFVWLSFLTVSALLHPQLKPLAVPLANGGLRPVFFFLLVWTVCQGLYRLGYRVLNNYAEAYVQGHQDSGQNRRQRVDTMIGGGRFLLATLVWILGLTWFVSALGVDLGKVFAGAGVAGIALGVVGKDILIDYFYGLNILGDDQFNLGDFIETPVATGIVENFNLRTTRIREMDGGLSIVTNGKFTVIKNHSRDFANADFRVGVAYASDIDRSMALICEIVQEMFQQNLGVLTPEPVFIGVHELGDSSVILRALVKTVPLQQWSVSRELNKRVLQRFNQEGVEIPFPQQKVWLSKEQDEEQAVSRSVSGPQSSGKDRLSPGPKPGKDE